MKKFKKLSDAYEDCLDTQFTYAVNYENSVSSYFVNATEKEFWDEYMLKGPKNNYEIIRVDRPCHLYLDLDNVYPELDIEIVWKKVKELIVLYFQNLNIPEEDLTFIKLSSHSEKKQSLHIIVKMKNKIFKSLLDCGYFVSKIKSLMSPFHSKIVDDAVYTKNRCFRMLGCTKAGQKRYLIGEKPLTFEYWKETKIQPLKWNGGPGSHLGFQETPKVSLSSSKYIPEIVYTIFNKLNNDPKFLKLSGKIDIPKVYAVPASLIFLCNTVSRKCPIGKKIHTTNVTYIHLDLMNSNYCLKCRSEKILCKGKRTKSYKIPNPLTKRLSF